MLGLGLGLTPGNPLFGSRGVTAAQVIAGVGPRVTPGYNPALTPGVTATGRTAVLGSGVGTTGWTQATGTNTSITFNQESDVTDFITATGFGVAGAGTEADPHIIRNLNLTTFDATRNDTFHVFYWNDTSGLPYWIKFENISFGVGAGINNRCGDLYINAPTGGGAIIQNCEFANFNGMEGANLAPVVCVNGTTRFIECAAHRMSNSNVFIYKNGASAIVEVIDSLFDASVGGWAGGSGFIYNAVTGGSALIQRCEFDYRQAIVIVRPYKDMAVTIDATVWNSSINTNCQGFISLGPYTSEAWDLGLTMTDCLVNGGGAAVTLVGWNTVNSNLGISNWDISYCSFLMTLAPGADNAFTVGIGKGNAVAAGLCDNVHFSWCKFTKPATPVVAGNEVFDIFNASNSSIKYCYVTQCGEDAYEYQKPWNDCEIAYCVAENCAGNVVDFWGGGGSWVNSTNCSAHHIWGDCGSDAVISEGCKNILFHDIDVDNVAGGFVQNPPHANVRFHSYAAGDLDGCVVSLPLTAVGESFGGYPCLLTVAPANTTACTGAQTGSAITIDSTTGFTNGVLVGVELDATSSGGTKIKHYTTQVGAPAGNVITLAEALPSVSTSGAVYAKAPHDAGTITWADGLGGSKTGTDMVVAPT